MHLEYHKKTGFSKAGKLYFKWFEKLTGSFNSLGIGINLIYSICIIS